MQRRFLFALAMMVAGCDTTSTPRSTATGGTMGTGGSTETGGVTMTGGVTETGGARGDAGSDVGIDLGIDQAPDLIPDVQLDAAAERPGTPNFDTMTLDGAQCPHKGGIAYTLTRNPNASTAELAAYPLITAAMDKAVYYYNCYTDIVKKLAVTYNPGVQTVDGNINGSIRFGPNTSYMAYATALHELGHTVGVGTAGNWLTFLPLADGGGTRVWIGANATAELRDITGIPTAIIKGDKQHFWPYGLNYAAEVKSEADVINHCRIVVALRKDMGMR